MSGEPISQELVSSSTSAKLNPLAGDTYYTIELTELELKWRDRYDFLLTHGYALRPRYRPDWKPSWISANLNPLDCEDAIQAFMPKLLDAESTKDGRALCIKMITRTSDEIEIGRYLSSESLKNARNHCVPIFDSFNDPIDPDIRYIVMPLLREFDDPEFGALGEVVDFVTQILEGVLFMHENLIAHGDLTGANIMMDASPIMPEGWHFMSPSFTRDGLKMLTPLARIDYPVRYYIIDFDYSVKFRPGQSPVIPGLGGRDGDVPELAHNKPFDHFKLDVFTVGNVFLKDFKQKYLGLDFLTTLIDIMMTQDPQRRPTAKAALQHWYQVRDKLDISMARWRLHKPNESVSERVIGAVATARDNLRYFFQGPERKSWSGT